MAHHMKIVILFLLLFTLCSAQAQIRGVTEKGSGIVHLEQHQFKFDVFSPGISYEFGLFKNQSVSTALGLGMAAYEPGYVFGLALNNRYRYYHNFQRRISNNKNVSGNSGNYIAAAQAIFFSQARLTTNILGPNDFNVGFYGAIYGIQRTYPKGFNFNAELGAGFYKGDGIPDGYGPLIGFTFGWVATKRTSSRPTFN
jgi:hypothetical protein